MCHYNFAGALVLGSSSPGCRDSRAQSQMNRRLPSRRSDPARCFLPDRGDRGGGERRRAGARLRLPPAAGQVRGRHGAHDRAAAADRRPPGGGGAAGEPAGRLRGSQLHRHRVGEPTEPVIARSPTIPARSAARRAPPGAWVAKQWNFLPWEGEPTPLLPVSPGRHRRHRRLGAPGSRRASRRRRHRRRRP